MYQKMKEYFEVHKQEMLDDIMAAIRIPSVNGPEKPGMPFGEENAKVLAFAASLAKELGLKAEVLENKVAVIDLNEQPAELDILAHLDVVPAGDGWTVTEPFVPVIRDGRLYGRGSSDDKGPAIAALYAMKAVKDLGITLTKNARLILGADEETACRDTEYYYSKFAEAPCSFSPDAEYPLINIEKGGLYTKYSAQWKEETALPRLISLNGGTAGNVVPNRAEAVVEGLSGEIIRDICRKTENETGIHFTVEPVLPDVSANQGERWFIRATGTSTHASTPWEGNNAVTGLIKAAASLPLSDSAGFRTLNGLAEIFPHNDYYGVAAGVAQKDEISGVLTLGTNMVDYQVTGLMGKIDSRAPLCASKENMLDVLRARLDAEGIQMDPESRMTPPHHVPEDKPFVQTLLSCYEQVMGEKGYCMAIGGGTYAHRLENGVAFGCMKLGTDYHMHGADEYLIIDEMVRSAELFALAIAEICQ